MNGSNDDLKRTVDGVPVKRGDRVWIDHGYGLVTTKKLDKTDLGFWWDRRSTEIYSTEAAALAAAIEGRKKALVRARRDAKAAEKSIARLRGRLARVAIGEP